MEIIKLKDESQIKEISKDASKLIIIDFFAEWCGPCRLLSEKIESMKDEYPEVTIFKADVEDFDDFSAEYNVKNIPTLIFMMNGMIVDRSVGMVEPTELRKIIEKHLEK